MCRGISVTYDGETETPGDTSPTSGVGQMHWGIREIHRGEIQTVGDTSPISVGQDQMRRGIIVFLGDESQTSGDWFPCLLQILFC